ncbi:MAG: cysteine hydrolase [Asgard group archaeon]|nr:cysteine hydrolase [Asgard group archaeon]
MNKSILDEWDSIIVPPAPEINSVVLDSKTTALLILDIQNQNCNSERRPRCIEALPKIQQLLSTARDSHVFVGYTLIRSATEADIRVEVQKLASEPCVASGVDKFYNTDLEQILKEAGIETVILVGTSAHGAVLNTATGASQRGFKVVIPIDGLSASEEYAEQYTIWHLANSPGTRRSVTLTTIEKITFE